MLTVDVGLKVPDLPAAPGGFQANFLPMQVRVSVGAHNFSYSCTALSIGSLQHCQMGQEAFRQNNACFAAIASKDCFLSTCERLEARSRSGSSGVVVVAQVMVIEVIVK